MSFRTIVITNKSKLNYKNRFLVVKQESVEKFIHLSEIDTIVVDAIDVSISTYLLKELSDNKINIVFCDEKHNPFGELISYYSSHNSTKKIMSQVKWGINDKDKLWSSIVKNKIINQALVLYRQNKQGHDLLNEYVNDVKIGDKTNREGHAAKIYFNSLFGKQFVRHSNDEINFALNYGYTLLLSTFNKEVISYGCITQLGIHHKNEFNEFNLSCDLMEPFRPIVDEYVHNNIPIDFNKEYRLNLINLLNEKFIYKSKLYILKDIIKLYVKDVLDLLELEKKKEYTSFIYER